MWAEATAFDTEWLGRFASDERDRSPRPTFFGRPRALPSLDAPYVVATITARKTGVSAREPGVALELKPPFNPASTPVNRLAHASQVTAGTLRETTHGAHHP